MSAALSRRGSPCSSVTAHADEGRQRRLPLHQAEPALAAVRATQRRDRRRGSRRRRRARRHRGSGSSVVCASRLRRAARARVPNLYPPSRSTLAVLRTRRRSGPGSFWYTDAPRPAARTSPRQLLPCFRVVTPGTCRDRPAVEAGVGAGRGRSPLSPAGSIVAPGAVSPAPRRGSGSTPARRSRSVSVTLAGVSLTVTAVPEVEWRFGDGVAASGTGMATARARRPAGAVTARVRHALPSRRPGPEPLRARELWGVRIPARGDRHLDDLVQRQWADRRCRCPSRADDGGRGAVSRQP